MTDRRQGGTGHRRASIDGLRGLALCCMIVFHSLYLLVLHGLLDLDLWSGFWWWFARAVAATFVSLAGWGLAARRSAAAQRPAGEDRAWLLRRCLRLGLAALLISLVSYLGFGRQSFVFFGVLHLLTLSSLLAWPLAKRPGLALCLGLLVLAAGLALGGLQFKGLGLAWLGFRPAGYYPMDYLPLAPWFAWLCFGILWWHLGARCAAGSAGKAGSARLPGLGILGSGLAFLGRHSLLVYLFHLPLLYALSLLAVLLFK